MKNYTWLAFLCLLFPGAIFGINKYQSGDTLYIWAYHGLHLRAAPSAAGGRLASMPYGAAIIVSDSVRTKAFSVKEYGGFDMKGYWSKVRFGTVEGWIFDGYLSKYPALRHFKRQYVDELQHEPYADYGKRAWGLSRFKRLELEPDKPARDTTHGHYIYTFRNGAVYEINRGVGDGGLFETESFQIPDFSFEECYLFFIYNAGFFNFDPTYNPRYKKAVEADSSGNSIERTATSVRINWGNCHYTFEKKGKMTAISWYCAC